MLAGRRLTRHSLLRALPHHLCAPPRPPHRPPPLNHGGRRTVRFCRPPAAGPGGVTHGGGTAATWRHGHGQGRGTVALLVGRRFGGEWG